MRFLAGLFLVAWVTGQRVQAQQWTGSGISTEPCVNSVIAALPVLPGKANRIGRVPVDPAAAFLKETLLPIGGSGELARRLIITGLVLGVEILLLLGLRQLKRRANALIEK